MPEVVLLAGPPRSGTTWLSRQLCASPLAYPFLPECTLVTQQIELYANTLHFCDRERFQAYFGTTENLRGFHAEIVRNMLLLIAALNPRPGARILVLKDPELALCLEDALELLPRAKVIALVRDPRDVVASMKQVVERKHADWDMDAVCGRIFGYYNGIEEFQRIALGEALFVRYEDLVIEGLGRVSAFLDTPVPDENPGPDQVDDVRAKLSTSDPFFSDLYLAPTTTARIGSHRVVLSEEDLDHVSAIFGGVLQRWQY